jgi:hypothetical protein
MADDATFIRATGCGEVRRGKRLILRMKSRFRGGPRAVSVV